MPKVFIVYDSKYGNTKIVAEKIGEGLNEVEGVKSTVSYAKKTKPEILSDFNAVLLGAPNHMGKPSRTITKFVDQLAKTNLKEKKFAIFDTYFGRPRNFEKAMKKLEKIVERKLPSWTLLASGLSIKVDGIKGPIADGELPKRKAFGTKIAKQLLK